MVVARLLQLKLLEHSVHIMKNDKRKQSVRSGSSKLHVQALSHPVECQTEPPPVVLGSHSISSSLLILCGVTHPPSILNEIHVQAVHAEVLGT